MWDAGPWQSAMINIDIVTYGKKDIQQKKKKKKKKLVVKDD